MAEKGRTVNLQNLEKINSKDFSWRFWLTLPIYPFGKRRTICKEIIPDKIWIFDQLQGIFYVVVPIRMTVVSLDEGGLLVYAPVAPTPECIRLVKELVAKHGEVKYIILPTISGLEHKIFVGPFARHFPKSQVFVAPQQWSFPINLPLTWLGLPLLRTKVLPQDSAQTPFVKEFDYAILGPIELGAGKFAEVTFLHKSSKTLLVTDSVVSIPEEPPDIVQLDPYPLLFHAKDEATDVIKDTKENRRKGWQRIALYGMYFRPSSLDLPSWGEVFRNSLKAPDRSKKAYFGLYPFKWQQNWQNSFYLLRGNGRLFVAPILQTLILNRAPKETLTWADKIASWDFVSIIPCHLDAPIPAKPHQFRQAFSFLQKHCTDNLPQEDFQVLKDIDAKLDKLGIPPAQDKV
ncbi:MAG: DUF4336 domain-containing protein [Cyanobacteria bacterium P01_A01_bin.84]